MRTEVSCERREEMAGLIAQLTTAQAGYQDISTFASFIQSTKEASRGFLN